MIFSPVKLLCGIVLVALLSSCGTPTPGTWINGNIPSGKQSRFHEMNDFVFASLKANDEEKLQDMLSKDMIDNNYTKRQVELISLKMKKDDYTIMDEYYVVNKYIDRDTIAADTKHPYRLMYPGEAQEMYFAFLIPKKQAGNQSMITVTYAKLNYGWKVTALELGNFVINGKTSPGLYAEAKAEYQKGYLVNTVNTMAMAIDAASPNLMFQYTKDDEMRKFYSEVLNEAGKKYRFPLIVPGVPTKPAIFKIMTQAMDDQGTYPLIQYMSKVKLSDQAAINREYAQVRQNIGRLIPGIDKDKKFVQYNVFNERPRYDVSVPRYEVVDTLK